MRPTAQGYEEMNTENGQPWIVGVSDDGVMAFTDDGIESPKNLIQFHKDVTLDRKRCSQATALKSGCR